MLCDSLHQGYFLFLSIHEIKWMSYSAYPDKELTAWPQSSKASTTTINNSTFLLIYEQINVLVSVIHHSNTMCAAFCPSLCTSAAD